MEKNLQQRLIGAGLLVMLGVVFIPMILDGSGYRERTERRIEMPPEPEYPPMSEIRLDPIEPTHVIEQKQLEAQPLPAASTDADATVAKAGKRPNEALKAPLKAFALQVATLSSEERAMKLRDTLRKDGYAAYVESESKQGRTSYRVRIGPELDRKRLDELDRKIRKDHKLDGFVVNHP